MIIHESLRRLCLPWARRQPPATAAAAAFDARREQARLSELSLRLAARLLQACEARGAGSGQAQALCDGLVAASPHLRLGWAWFGPADTEQIEPQVISGPAAGYARALRVPRTRLTELGPAFRALAGRSVEPFNVSELSLYAPWRDAARAHGVRSVLALPLAVPGDARRGLFVLYADVPDYFDQVGLGLFDALAQFVAAVLSQQSQQLELERRAHTDPLTGLHNRAAAQAALQSRQAQRPLSLVLLDLDHFKLVNDRHGHPVGDTVLASCAQRLQAQLRHNDGIARWGGEEFLVWLPATGIADASRVAEKLRVALADNPLTLQGNSLPVTLSAGVAIVAEGESVEQALARADRALYRAKAEGRNRVALD